MFKPVFHPAKTTVQRTQQHKRERRRRRQDDAARDETPTSLSDPSAYSISHDDEETECERRMSAMSEGLVASKHPERRPGLTEDEVEELRQAFNLFDQVRFGDSTFLSKRH